MKIGIAGIGKMGEALARGLKEAGHEIQATTRSEESAAEVVSRMRIKVHHDNAQLAAQSDVILVCVKPHQARGVLAEMSSTLNSKKLLISICASLTTEDVEVNSGKKCPVIRSMPNTPCLIGEGVTALALGKNAGAKEYEVAKKIFETVGKVVEVEENLMDGVTGLSGCGPAYAYMIIESLSEAGVKVGLPRGTATMLAAQTLLGASKMVLSRGEHPAALKDEVTTPAGCTIDGLMALEEGKLRVTLIKAVLAAARRSEKLRLK